MKFFYHIFIVTILFTTLFSDTKIDKEINEYEKVSLQLQWKFQFQFAGFIMAKEKGFYKDIGLDVNIKEWKQNINMADIVLDQTSTYSIARPTLLIDIANGKDILLLATIFQSSPLALVTTKESGITSIKDFKHKRMMATQDMHTDASLISMIFSQGVDIKDIVIQNPSFNVKDLIDKKTDLIASYISNEPFLLKQLGAEPIIFSPKDFGFNYYNDLLITSQEHFNQNPKQVQNFTNASLKGWEYAFDNIDETIQVILKKYNTQNKTKQALKYEANELKKLAYFETNKIGKLEKHKLEKIYSVYKLLGLVKKDISFEKLILNQMYLNLNLTRQEQEYLYNNKIIRMCNNPNWEPIEFKKDGSMYGIAIDTLNIIEKKLNIKFESIETKNWTQSQKFLKDKKCDILPSATKTIKTQKYANFTKPYLNLPLSTFTTKDKHIVSALDNDLNNARYTGMVYNLSIAIQKDNPTLLNILNKTLNSISKDTSKQIIRKWIVPSSKETIIDYKLITDIFVILCFIIIFFIYKHYMLKKSVKESKELINATIEAIIIHKDGLCIDVNQSALDMFGFDSKEDFNGNNILQQVSPKSLALVKEQMYIDNTKLYEATLIRKDKSEFYGLVQGKFIQNKTLRLASIIDITLLKEQEQLIAEQSKMVQMGEMIGNIAHQWRQPLSVISIATSAMQMEKEMEILNDKKFKKYTDSIIKNTEFLSNTIDIFREYIKEKKEFKNVILQDRLSSAINVVEASLQNNHIEFINNINQCKPIKINLIVGELSQVIINIINNAKDILIEKNNEKDEIDHMFIKMTLTKTNNKAIITIQDNGGGIPDEIMPKIFDPYFTTKHQSIGTGLGLHMSKEIIEKHLKGKLYAKNNKDGAIFFIELPIQNK